ncbi:MAG: DNA polymerase [Ilumatobacteraceae bacterium]
MIDVHLIDSVLGTTLRYHPDNVMVRESLQQIDSAQRSTIERINHDIELDLILRGATERGYLIDRSALETIVASAEAKAAHCPEFAVRSDSHRRLNPRSNKQLIRQFEALGVTFASDDHNGEPKLDSDALIALSQQDQTSPIDQLARAVLDFRTADNLAKTLRGLRKHLTVHDRVHPVIDVVGAKTGRMTMSAPALQGLTDALRHVVLAEPGTVLVTCDLNQIEIRIAAALSEDQQLIQSISTGDIYLAVAAELFGRQPTTADRKIAKQAMLMNLYGAGTNAIAQEAGMSFTDADDLQRRFRVAYPALDQWCQHVTSLRTITTVFNRTLNIRGDTGFTAVNHLIQATGRDMFGDMILSADAAGLDIWLPIHDELIVLARRQQAVEASHELETLMTSRFLGVPIAATAKILGARWGKKPGM